MMEVRVAHKFAKLPQDSTVLDVTVNGGSNAALSPFIAPGGHLYDDHSSINMENAWQYAKVYPGHAGPSGNPTEEYWRWAKQGWANPHAVRYPMGRGARPLYSLWNGERLPYIEARQQIYAPLYARAIARTDAFARLRTTVNTGSGTLYLRDWDGYDHERLGMSFADVFDQPRRKMGHAFVIAMLLAEWEDRRFSASKYL